MNLKNYNNDGANYQARAVLAFMQPCGDIEESWDSDRNQYTASINVARWENCREQGYVLTMISKNHNKQLNIAFFEHRNSDEICAVKWIESPTINSPTISTAKFGGVYKTKYDVSFTVGHGEIKKMSEWLIEQFRAFYLEV